MAADPPGETETMLSQPECDFKADIDFVSDLAGQLFRFVLAVNPGKAFTLAI